MGNRGAEQQLPILAAIIFMCLCATATQAQNRGVYPLGLSAINSGVGPEPGLTYNNSFLFYSRSE